MRCSAPRCARPARSWASPRDFPTAFAKAQAAAGADLPTGGTVFITVTDPDKPAASAIAAQLHDLGFRIVATRGTALSISRMGVPVEPINKIGEGPPTVVDWIESGDVDLVINTPTGTGARTDGYEIRRAAVARGVPCITTLSGGSAAARAIGAARAGGPPEVLSLQEIHARAEPAGVRVSEPRTLAPFGRRLGEVEANERVGAYTRLRAGDPGGPEPAPGQFYMLAARERWGEGRTSARSFRGPSPTCATTRGGWSSCWRTSARARGA